MKMIRKLFKCIAGMTILLGIWGLPMFAMETHAASEMEVLKDAISKINSEVNDVKTDVQELQTELGELTQNNVGISKIEKKASEGVVDTYTITMTDGTTYDFTVTNGVDGKDGVDGENAVSQVVSDNGADSSLGVAAMAVALLSLIGNMVMAVS